jgi:hypothetical protein
MYGIILQSKMKNRIIALAVGMILLLFSPLTADPYFEPANPFEGSHCMWFDSLNVRFVGNWPFGSCQSITGDSTRHIGFCGSGGGVYILLISVPSNPILLSEGIHTRGNVIDLYYDESPQRLYTASGYGFEIWDVSNSSNPYLLGCHHDTARSVSKLHVSGNYAYIIDGDLRIFDVSNPSIPQEVCHYVFEQAADVFVVDSLAYVVQRQPGTLFILNISDPSNPQELSSTDVLHAMYIEVIHPYAYISNRAGLWIIDISDPLNPYEVGYYVTSQNADGGHIVKGNYAYVPNGSEGICIIDISTPSNPQLVGALDTPGYVRGAFVFDNHAFIADDANYGIAKKPTGVRIIDVSDPENPIEVNCYETPHGSRDLCIADSFAYIASAYTGLRIIDISDLSNPMEIGCFSAGDYAMGVAVSGSYAYMACMDSGMRVIDISSPANPQQVGYCDTPGEAWRIAIQEPYAYVADQDSSLRVIDISNPANPQEIGFLPQPCRARDVCVLDSFAYVADGYNDFLVVDISDPTNPAMVGNCSSPYGPVNDIYVLGQYAYTAVDDIGMQIIDISNPANPTEIGFWNSGIGTNGVSAIGSYAYIFTYIGDLDIIDVSVPTTPSWCGWVVTQGVPRAVFPCSCYFFTGNEQNGMQIFENLLLGIEEEKSKLPTLTPRLIISPNPFSEVTSIRLLRTRKSQKFTLKIYDASGRRVSEISLLPFNFSLGVTWDGRDEAGNVLPPGIYFLKLNGKPVGKVVKVK